MTRHRGEPANGAERPPALLVVTGGIAAVGVIVLFAIGVSALVATTTSQTSHGHAETSGATGEASQLRPSDERPPAVPVDAEAAIVDRVVDGDTVRVVAAPGGSIPEGGSIRVRLLNIDAPELARGSRPDECGARAATERLASLIASGDLVWLAADREDRDRYDRPLRAMWTDDGVFVNEQLVQEGYAVAVMFAPNDRFDAVMRSAEERARTARAGIWGPLCP